jgi:Holliday junction resolvasome RuvABC DNA-binding subunit
MFQDVIDQVREDGEVETQEIIEAINALGIADLPTIAQIEEAFPELNDVSLEQIKDTVSTLLSEAGLLTAEQFTEAMANVLTPEQLATALADLPYGDAEDFAEAISNAGLATPEDITTALTDANLATSEDIAGLARAFVQSGFATPTDVVTALSESGLATPEDIATALSESGLATLEQIITAFTDSGLATSEDIAGLARTFTQSGFATPQDLADAFEAAGLATPQDVIDAISAAGLATPQDVADALEAFGFTDAQLEQITGALPEGLTTDQLNTALSDALAGIATGTDLDTATTTITDAIGALGFATPQDVRDALSEFGFTEAQLQQIVGALPEGLSVSDLDTALEGVVVGADLDTAVTTITDAISGLDIASAQDVRDALSEFNFSEDQLNQIINALPESLSTSDLATALENVVVGTDLDTAVTDITTAISGLDIASPDDVREILAEYGFTAEQLEQIAGSITIPESATVAEIQNIVNAIPAGLTAEEVATQLSSQFEGLTTGIAGVQGGIDQLAEDLGLSTEGLLTAIENLGTTSGEDLTELQTNILEGLGLLSQDLGVDIGDVVTSVTDLEAGLTENITGLSDQLTGVEEAVGGVTTAVNRGIEDLADALGVQTDDITSAIVTLGSGLGGELTELETSVLSGLSSLADSLGTDVGTVVDSIGGLGTDISANIQGLSDTLGEQLGAGFGGLGEQLGAGFGQLGQQLGLATLGLFGLGAKQPTAQQIAAAQDKFEFKPFEEQMKPRQVQQVVQARPVQQQPSALQQINKFIDRQSNISRPANQGMFTGDPNRKLA